MVYAPKLKDWIIIETSTDDSPNGRAGMVILDPMKNSEYAKLKQAEATKTLPKVNAPNVVPCAALFATEDMFMTHVYDEQKGEEVKDFRDEIVLARADGRGRFWIPADQPELARRILRDCRKLDKSARLDPEGCQLVDEVKPVEQVNKGGRPRKGA